ncbi:cordon-bleu protein-like 1b isoform X2 [Scyliorhinus canicula]|uniref:cordon-bleu protein-like 1b isoform X2 n=1 Tax=Scyliorhinus canicula TaxID=7830 RepID=UPI0018F65C13|nr:cordon-bleu protein-like 1b isoform X2 [Scyliorhinus canicula]
MASKRSKPKAPAPPTFSKHVESSSVAKRLEGEDKTMEQKDNVNRHFDLTVVLPGGLEQSTNINGSTPMMDLLIFLCGKFHLNPSSHVMELVGKEKNLIQFKPNTLVGALEVEKVILKQKNMEEKKKPISVVPEQTVRVVINYKKTQKTIVRVSPLVPLQELVPIISNKCEFNPKSTILVKDFECLEPYDLTKSLKELGLREVYALDTSIGYSQVNFQSGSMQGQPQVPGNISLEKENKSFFNMFRLSKKKREKPASAPATPLVSQQRPLGMSSASAYCPTYESNTLPSDLPKKRRAPAPPLSVSQSFPKDLTQQALTRSTSYASPDDSANGTVQNMTGPSRQRTESLPLGVAASHNSKKTKRKAPLPPSKMEDQNTQDYTTDSNLRSVDSCPNPDAADKTAAFKMFSTSADEQAGIGIEHSLEEIVETEEIKALDVDDAEGAIVRKGEVTLCKQDSIDVPSNSENAQTSEPGNLDVTDKEINSKPEGKVSTAEGVYNQIVMEKDENSIRADMDKDLPMTNTSVGEPPISKSTNSEVYQGDSDGMAGSSPMLPPDQGPAEKLTQTSEVMSISRNTRNSPEPKHLANASSPSSNVTVKDQNKYLDQMEINDRKFEAINAKEADKALDFQNVSFTKAADGSISPSCDTTIKHTSADVQHPHVNNFTLQVSPEQQNSADPDVQGLAGKQGILPAVNQPATESSASTDSCASLSTKDAIGSPESPTKIPMLYKSESEPKPKPSNEITRDYIPKIGMTTYKIVPSKSLENEAFVVYGIMPEAEIADHQTSYDFVPEPDISKKSTKQPETSEEPLSSVIRELAAFHHRAHFDTSEKGMPINSTTQFHYPETAGSTLAADSEAVQPKLIVNRRTQSSSERKMKSGSVFLQLHKRSSGQYVTSALARSSSLPSQSSFDRESTSLFKEENGVPCQEVSPTNTDDPDAIIPPPPEFAAISERNAQKELSKSGERSASRPSKPPKVPSKPNIRVKLSDTRGLGTTVAATKTHTSTSPSPFALAVSSAVKKTQTNATYSFKPESTGTDSSTLSSPTKYADRELHLPSSTPNESNHNNIIKQTLSPERETGKDRDNTAGTQAHHTQSKLPSPSRESKPTFISQVSDPGEIHQSVLDAIRSGEGAAKLKKVDTLATM